MYVVVGGMFVQLVLFVEKHSDNIKNISIYDQRSNPIIWKIVQRYSRDLYGYSI